MSANSSLVACWFDRTIGGENNELDMKKRFQGVSNRITSWCYFDCADSFKKFIDDNPNMNLVAIISGNFAKQYLTGISDRNCVHSVYIYCGDRDRYKNLVNEPKVQGVFNHPDDLYEKMERDLQ